MSCKLTFERFVLITAETRDASADDVEPTIARPKAMAALEAPLGGPDEFVLYSDPVEQAARCCVAVIRNRPLSEDNKRVAYKCMLEMLVRYPWAQLDPERKKIAEMLDGVGDGTKDEEEFVLWVRGELGLPAWLRYQLRYGLAGT
jgi:prophage maintenance system killer protein